MTSIDKQTYSVVKFKVKVRLSDISANSHVGSDIVVNVTTQYRAPGTTLNVASIARPNKPKDEDGAGSTTLDNADAVVRANAAEVPDTIKEVFRPDNAAEVSIMYG